MEFPEEIFAGLDTPFTLRLLNKRKLMPSFLIRVGIEGHEVLFPFLPAASHATRHMNLTFGKRGRHALSEVIISSVFPFNFFTRYRRVSFELLVTVFPKPVRCQLLDVEARRVRSNGETSSDLVGFDSDIVSIRDYVAGDPLKYIDWKSTARTGLLKTKEYSAIQTQNVVIDFDRMDKTNLERTISCATFAILKLTKTNTPVGLIIDGETIKPAVSLPHKVRMLTKLALYGQD